MRKFARYFFVPLKKVSKFADNLKTTIIKINTLTMRKDTIIEIIIRIGAILLFISLIPLLIMVNWNYVMVHLGFPEIGLLHSFSLFILINVILHSKITFRKKDGEKKTYL